MCERRDSDDAVSIGNLVALRATRCRWTCDGMWATEDPGCQSFTASAGISERKGVLEEHRRDASRIAPAQPVVKLDDKTGAGAYAQS